MKRLFEIIPKWPANYFKSPSAYSEVGSLDLQLNRRTLTFFFFQESQNKTQIKKRKDRKLIAQAEELLISAFANLIVNPQFRGLLCSRELWKSVSEKVVRKTYFIGYFNWNLCQYFHLIGIYTKRMQKIFS